MLMTPALNLRRGTTGGLASQCYMRKQPVQHNAAFHKPTSSLSLLAVLLKRTIEPSIICH